jgi:ribose transport system substrate-binding protein
MGLVVDREVPLNFRSAQSYPLERSIPMKHFKWICLLSLVVAVLGTSIGCRESGSGDNDQLVIAVIPKGTTHEFWQSIKAGAEKAGEEYDVEIRWQGPLREDNRAEQIKVVETMTLRGVDGIVLAPLDESALQRPVESAVKGGTPVVIIDSALQGDDFSSFIATDNYKGGELAARSLAESTGETGTVLVIRYQEGSASTMNREQGFIDVMKAEYPNMTVVGQDQYVGATAAKAQPVIDTMLTRYQDSGLVGIFASNESSGRAALLALQDYNDADSIKYVCFDTSEKLNTALDEGKISALIVQDPVKMGYLGVKTIVQILNGEEVPERIDTGVSVITKENMDEPGMQRLLWPMDNVDTPWDTEESDEKEDA